MSTDWTKLARVTALISITLAIGLELGIYVGRQEAKRNAAETTPVRVETMKPVLESVDSELEKLRATYEQIAAEHREKARQQAIEQLSNEGIRPDEHFGKEAEPKGSD